MKTYGAAVFVYTLILLTSCSDDNDGNPSPEALVGHIIYEYTSDVKIVDLNDWTERIFFSYNASGRLVQVHGYTVYPGEIPGL